MLEMCRHSLLHTHMKPVNAASRKCSYECVVLFVCVCVCARAHMSVRWFTETLVGDIKITEEA